VEAMAEKLLLRLLACKIRDQSACSIALLLNRQTDAGSETLSVPFSFSCPFFAYCKVKHPQAIL
jgi:hypothetical protein